MALAGLKSSTTRILCAFAAAACLLACLAFPTRADKKSDARDQFAEAVRMRTMLEGYLEKDRSRSDYVQTIAAFHKVYLITPDAENATSALIAEAELYTEMGRLYDPSYYKSAVAMYSFLMKQYPGSRYRSEALISIGKIQNDDLNDPHEAEATYKQYLILFPRSDRADEARAALKAIGDSEDNGGAAAHRDDVAATRTDHADRIEGTDRTDRTDRASQPRQVDPVDKAAQMLPVDAPHVTPQAVEHGLPVVKDFKTWDSPDSARIVVNLGNTVEFRAVHIASPERIYFDLYKAQVGPKLPRKPIDVQGGMLKTIRIAQNKPDTVRLVLDVDGAKDYSAFLVEKPYRLVIDLRTRPSTSGAEVASSAKPPHTHGTTDKAVAAEMVSVKASDPTPDSTTAKSISKAALRAAKTHPKAMLPESAALEPPPVPEPNRDGERSLTRALGLKINRIVIDAGHGGHDTGTIGPHGLLEKDVCLDVALRLGNLIEQKLPGADVIYTRKDDTFVPLEERTQIANDAKADLFISIHANSSEDPAARGVETYYLNFATSADAMEVAARENAESQESMHDLQDLIKKIARNDKIEESKDLAEDIQDSLSNRLQLVSRNERNRGVKKAPFVVLIGANMPSVLAEISFLSNPYDESLLRKAAQRQRIADGLYRGIANYLASLNSLSPNKAKLISDNHVSETRLADGTLAPSGNPK
jgi:N-acetylmuramoyl-L-alanine amidase